MPFDLNINTNEVIISSSQNHIIVEDRNKEVVLNIEQPISKVIEVISKGPKGDQGDSIFIKGDGFYSTTSSIQILGSLLIDEGITGSFTGSFVGDGSGLTGINASKWTGSIDGISRESNVYITGSFGVTNPSKDSLFLINSQGTVNIKSNASDIFLIKNENNINLLNVNQSGVIILSTQSVELTDPAPNGGIYFTSNSFFIGID